MLKRQIAVATIAAAGMSIGTVGAAEAASGWSRVAQCESGGNSATNTGNGYYGRYQFDRQTWQSLGYRGTANQYSAATQTRAAERLYAQRGSAPWPVCGKHLSGAASTGPASTARQSARHSRNVRHYARHYTGAKAVQHQLNKGGAGLAVDGIVGPLTRGAIRHFQAVHRLSVDGVYGPRTARALF